MNKAEKWEELKLRPPKCIKVDGIKELVRFAASMISLGQATYIIHFEDKGKHIYGLLAVYHDYYNYYGVPLFYYCICEKPVEGCYALIKMSEKEEFMISDGVKPGWVAAPIINLKEKPDFIEVE